MAVPPQTLPTVAPGYWIARTISYAISPVTLAPLLFGLVTAQAGATGYEVALAVGVGLVFFGIVPVVYLVWLVQRGAVLSIDVRDRRRRLRPFLVSIGSNVIGIAFTLTSEGAGVRLAAVLMACSVLNAIILLLITLQWKISIHNAAAAGFAAVLAFAMQAWSSSLIGPVMVVLAFLLVPLVAWARLRTAVHTRGQVAAGVAFGLVVPVAELWLLQQYGLLPL